MSSALHQAAAFVASSVVKNTLQSKMKAIYIFLVVLVLLFLLRTNEGFQVQEVPMAQKKIVVCLLCVCPNDTVITFANKISKEYDVYVIADDINCHVPETDVTILKISDDESKNAGFTKSSITLSKVTSAWDKALYYFCVKDTSPDHVWFIEEDVLIPRVSLLKELDSKYPDSDLLAKQHVSQDEDPNFTWWYDADGIMEKPLYRTLVCASRLSRALLTEIKDFVDEHKRLLFVEMMFSTIIDHKNMKLDMPNELATIIWRYDWRHDMVDENHLYHPIKKVEDQQEFRKIMSKKQGSKVEAFKGFQRKN